MNFIETFVSNEKVQKVFLVSIIFLTSVLYQTDYFPIAITIMIFISMALLLFCWYKKWFPIKEIIQTSFFIWYFVFWIFVLFITFIRNIDQVENLFNGIVSLSSFIFCFCIIYRNINNNFSFFLKTIKFVAIFICIWILLFDLPLLLQGERIGFSIAGRNPNNAGTILGIFSIFVLYKIQSEYEKGDIFTYLLLCLLILLTGSKKALLILCTGLIMLIFKNGKLNKKRLTIIFICFFLFGILCFFVPLLYDHIGRRFLSLLGGMGLINFQSDHSTSLRVVYIQDALKLWSNYPILGGGYDYFRVYSGFNTYSHCNYTELLSSTGLIGFIWYYGYYVLMIKHLISTHLTSIQILSLLLLFSFFLTDVGSVTLISYPLYYISLFIIYHEADYVEAKRSNVSDGK